MELAWLMPGLSLGAFVLIVCFGRLLPNSGSFLSISAITAGFVIFLVVLVDFVNNGLVGMSYGLTWMDLREWTIDIGITIDSLSIVMLGLITSVSLLVQVYSLEYMRHEPRFGWYFAVQALFAAAMLGVVLADNLLLLYIAWELVGLGSYLLIGFWWERKSASEAAKKAFITTRIGDIGLLIGIILLFRATGSFDISTIIDMAQSGQVDQGTLGVASFLMFLGAMGKSAQFPFHVWLPDAMEGPTPVSALIHAATMVAAGVYLVARMLPMFELIPGVMLFISSIGLITFIYAASLAVVSQDMKKILAYSTISHLGLMMLSLGALGLAAAMFHLVAHGFAKACLFLGAGNIMHSMDDEVDIRNMGGLRRLMPMTTAAFVIAAASLAGIAPLVGFFTKDEILVQIFDHRHVGFSLAAILGFTISAFYVGRLVLIIFWGSTRKSGTNKAHDPSMLMMVPFLALTLLTIFMGLMVINWSNTFPSFSAFLTGVVTSHFKLWLAVVSFLMTVCGVGVAWVIYCRGVKINDYVCHKFSSIYHVLLNKYFIDEFYQFLIDRVVLAFSKLISHFDRSVLNDGIVDRSALGIRFIGMCVRVLQTGRVYNYGMTMGIGIVGLMVIWWFFVG